MNKYISTKQTDKITLIKGGNVVTGDSVSCQDVLIRGEKIIELGGPDPKKADLIINAEGLLVLPGAVDTHVHFNDEFMNTVSVHDYYSGTLAAAFGGVTSIVDFSNQEKGESLINTIMRKKDEAKGKAIVDWGVHPVITQMDHKTLNQIPDLINEGAPTVKCYMTYREEGLMMDLSDLENIMKSLRDAGGMLMVHAENNEILEKNISSRISLEQFDPIYHARSRPPEAENQAIRDCIKLARNTAARLFIVHMSTSEGVDMVGSARKEGLDVFAETCTHYLFFTEDVLKKSDGIKWICSPPLRSSYHQSHLWKGLKDGRISMVTSDDAAYSWKAKLMGKDRFDRCPNGIPGIEPRFNILYSEGVAKNRLSLPEFVKAVSTTPATLFGLAPNKGSINPGADADIVLFDPDKKWTLDNTNHHMATDWTAYENIELTGKIERVFSRGELIIDGDKCLANKGRGRFLHRDLNLSGHTAV